MPNTKNKPASGGAPGSETTPEKKRRPVTHSLKTWPEYYHAVESGEKPFEVRKNDRDFQVGDVLLLRKYQNPRPGYEHVPGFYTGAHMRRRVTYILHGPGFGVEAGFCILGLEVKRPATRARKRTDQSQNKD